MCVKVANTSRILLASLLVLVLVNLSEQQFSYSANWGKRSAAAAPVALTQIASRQRMEMDCHSFIKIKQLLPESRIPSRLDALFKEYINFKISVLCRADKSYSLDKLMKKDQESEMADVESDEENRSVESRFQN